MRSFLLAAAAATLMSGCASTPQAKFYTLGARPAQENAQTAPARLSISIDAVTVPELVDRPQMVVRIDATQVRIDEYARWAEPLKSQITNVLVADLAQALPGALVTGYGQWAGEAQSYHLQIDVQSFESAADMATIGTVWTVRSPKKGSAVSGRTVVHEPVSGQGYDALVDAHSRALAIISRDIAAAIRAGLAQ